MLKKAAIALLTCLMLIPAASAQPGEASLTIDDPLSGAIDAGGSTDVNFSLTVGCDLLLAEGGSATFTVSADLPAEYGASSEDVDVMADPECVTGSTAGAKTATGSISIMPTEGAMGNNMTSFSLTADGAGLSPSADNGDQIWIAYVPGHELDPDIDFPYTMTAADGDQLSFNVTVTISANSDTMVMFMESGASTGDVTGFSNEVFNIKSGDERTRTKTITFIPPESEWDNATISFYNFSHCLDSGFDCPEEMQQNITWTIQNGGVSTGGGGGGDDNESPPPSLISLVLGLAAAAFVATRRR